MSEYMSWARYIKQYPATPWEAFSPLTKGDRVRIREGYDGAGLVYFYKGKHLHDDGIVNLTAAPSDGERTFCACLAAAIEPYPYTREERIERAIEDLEAMRPLDSWDFTALLYAILDAGV